MAMCATDKEKMYPEKSEQFLKLKKASQQTVIMFFCCGSSAESELESESNTGEPLNTTRPVYCCIDKNTKYALAERVACILSHQNSTVIDYSLSDVIPSSTHSNYLHFDINNRDTIIRLPGLWLRFLHLNEDIPQYQNIKLRSRAIFVKEGLSWVECEFKHWLRKFLFRVTRVVAILNHLEIQQRNLVATVIHDNIDEVETSIYEEFKRGLSPSVINYVI
jgi:hypothetical protein